MEKTLVAVADSVFPSLDPARRALARVGAELKLAEAPTNEAILEVARQADGLLVTYATIPGEIIRQLERCRVIARFGIGLDNIDVETATEAGIVVTYVPDYCVEEVSDHAMALLLNLARKVTFADRLVQAGRWEMKAVVPLRRLRGRTLGLVGFGHIPQVLAPKAQAFGLKVIAADPYVADEKLAALGVERVEFDELLTAADYISIHAPLTDETHHLFNADVFRRMKPEALLVNTARGPLVDVAALAEALDRNQLAGAALDVLPEEPPPGGSPLFNRDDVILTPHAAFYSEEALLDLQTKAAEDVARVLSGEPPRYPVNVVAQ
jgi:D-3-phosphoglycerate dehydrogenase / 2-oxoglutarate reductase